VRLFGEVLREYKADLGELVSIEAGKITQEGLGEVQEMIDICDFAVGLSRQLYGLTIASERPGHHMRETWHPLGVVGVISAFNFPVAVWAWNTALALVAATGGVEAVEKTPLTALACQALFDALKAFGDAAGLSQLVIGGREAGEALVDDPRVPLVSATGSTRMGREVAHVSPRASPQHPRTGRQQRHDPRPERRPGPGRARHPVLRRRHRRPALHHPAPPDRAPFDQGRSGCPPQSRLRQSAHRRPTQGQPGRPADRQAVVRRHAGALAKARDEGGKVFGGERQLAEQYPNAYYVSPAIAEMPEQSDVVRHETFAPILYVLAYDDFEEALRLNNEVPQGPVVVHLHHRHSRGRALPECLGQRLRHRQRQHRHQRRRDRRCVRWREETGGGRESGSDAWKGYMRRQTNTVNYSRELPLAQGIVFD
jgi:aldehyde dehydrogenase (NAD+)